MNEAFLPALVTMSPERSRVATVKPITNTMNLFAASWQRCWRQVGASGDGASIMEALLHAYSEPQRKYHTLQHLGECLALFELHRRFAMEPGEVELALWFHDAVYDVHAGDNEARSADWAAQALRSGAVAERRIEHVRSHILATRHDAVPSGPDQQLVIDIDLAILGASSERYAEYEQQVRDEYDWVPVHLFRIKRKALLQEFLRRPRIYGTDAIFARREKAARANLKASIAALEE